MVGLLNAGSDRNEVTGRDARYRFRRAHARRYNTCVRRRSSGAATTTSREGAVLTIFGRDTRIGCVAASLLLATVFLFCSVMSLLPLCELLPVPVTVTCRANTVTIINYVLYAMENINYSFEKLVFV